jgi:hypothetical protein
MIKNRIEFADHVDKYLREHGPHCIREDHPLWYIEKSVNVKCNYFVKAVVTTLDSEEYLEWVRVNLTGVMLCYVSDKYEKEEWWGFENEQDAIIWVLRWV